MFNATDATEVVVDNCEFRDLIGGALFVDGFVDGTGSITASVFENNMGFGLSSSCCAGAVAIRNSESASVLIADSSFSRNIGEVGGAFSIESSSAELDGNSTSSSSLVTNTRFESNVARKGGAIFQMAAGPLNVTRSVFVRNVANVTGGSIYVSQSSESITILDSDFAESSAELGRGGAVALSEVSSAISIENSSFVSSVAGTAGGALDIELSTQLRINILSSFFVNNMAMNSSGGAVSVDVADELNLTMTPMLLSNISIEDTRFTGCFSGDDGGALRVFGTRGFIDIANCTFDSNTAEVDAGAFLADSTGNVTIESSTFVSNMCRGDDGGALRARDNGVEDLESDTSLIIRNSDFIENEATNISSQESGGGDGGAINVFNLGNVFIENSMFRLNQANDDGGALSIRIIPGIAAINSSAFVGNEGGDLGGAAFLSTIATYASENNTFEGNTCGDDGGATYLDSVSSRFTSREDTYISNNARQDGGAICLVSSAGDVDISQTDLFMNRARVAGGSLLIDSSNDLRITLDQVNATGSIAGNNGGAIFVNSQNSTVVVFESEFIENESDFGGALLVLDADLVLSSTKFIKNSATFTGGAIEFIRSIDVPDLSVTNCTFQENALLANDGDTTGGALAAISIGDVIIDNSTFIQNNASAFNSVSNFNSGGGAYFERVNAVQITQSSFVSNFVAGEGGGFSAADIPNDVNVTDCTFTSNIAQDGGPGSFRNVSGSATSGNTFVDNEPSDNFAVLW